MKAQITINRKVPILADEVDDFALINDTYAKVENYINAYLDTLSGSEKQESYLFSLTKQIASDISRECQRPEKDLDFFQLWEGIFSDLLASKVGISTAIDTLKRRYIDIQDYNEHKAKSIKFGRWS